MSNEYEIWPFLIGRSYDKDYKVIVTPDFISRSENTHLLSIATGNIDLTNESDLISRQVYAENFEPFTVIFQVKRVQRSVIRSTAEEPLRDSFDNKFLVDEYRRPISIVEGIVAKTSTLEDFKISAEFFEEIHGTLIDYFNNFWEGDSTTKSIDSRMFIVQDSGSSEYLKIQSMEPLDLRLSRPVVSRKSLYIVIFGIFLSGLISIIYYRISTSPDPKTLPIATSTQEKVDVTSPDWKTVPIKTSTKEKVDVDVDIRSIRKSKENVDFTYRIGNEQISARADCNLYRKNIPKKGAGEYKSRGEKMPFVILHSEESKNQSNDDESKSPSTQVTWAILKFVCR